ncbi:MAG: d(CMP) kinase [Paracoccaceae bacterium]
MKFTVAIDGPAAAGKGTISKAVAAHFGFAYLDTGLLYRAVGRKVLAGSNPVEAAGNLNAHDLAGPGLRTPAVAQAASEIAVNAKVRAALLTFQRNFAARDGGSVLDGRDIGSVICPDADVKLFVTASSAVRAQRRFDELTSKGVQISLVQVQADIATRDDRDASRENAPTKQAKDAFLLDTTIMTTEAAIAAAITAVRGKFDGLLKDLQGTRV